MPTPALNPAYLDGYPQGWSVQNVLGQGGGDESLVSGGSAPTTGIGGGGAASQGLTAWTYSSMVTIGGSATLATGKQVASRFFWPGGNINSLWVHPTTVATTQTHGWLAVYDGTGVKWAASADLGSTPLVTGSNSVPIASAPVPAPSGYYYAYAVFVFSAGTYTFDKFGGAAAIAGTSAMNDNLPPNNWVFAFDATDTITTALPASLVWGTNWAADFTYMAWFGIS